MKSKNLSTKEQWESLHEQARFRPKYPSERVVQWASTLPRGAKVLDHGCGAGRHSRFLTKEGFWVKSYDVSLVYPLATDQFPTDTDFDAVLSYGVLNYLPFEEQIEEIERLYRCLKSGGTGLFVVRSDRTTSSDRGDSHIVQYNWNYIEKNIMFPQFSSVQVDYQDATFGSHREHDWVIQVTR